MALRRTSAGLSHGEAPPGRPLLVLQLKSGWQLEPGGRAVVHGKARRVVPDLPAGAALVPAAPLPVKPRGRQSPAEAELARFVHLRLPGGASPSEWLEFARGWEFVESAQPPASVSLP